MENKTFKIGDWVVWTSQAGGHARTKIGQIVEVVPPATAPQTKVKEPGATRGRESYVVRATYTDAQKRKRTTNYWPLVKKLAKTAGPRGEENIEPLFEDSELQQKGGESEASHC